MSSKSSIHLMMFYMQSKEMYKLTPQLCRIAKKEFEDTRAELPVDVRDDISFNKILKLIEHVENSEFAKANETLGDAFKEYEEMMSYFTPKKRADRTESPSIFEENWEPPVQQDAIPIPPPVQQDAIPTPPAVKHTANEDESRNLRKKSPRININDNELDLIGRGSGDEENNTHRLTYMTTLRPRDATSSYEAVYVSHSPAVLAENFTALYKKEWKAAHDELESTLGEKQTVRHMLWIIAKSSIVCASLATQQLADIENSVVGVMVSRDPLNKMSLVDESLAKRNEHAVAKARNMLVDYRRELATLSVPMLQKEIKRAIATELGTSLPRRFTGIGNHFTIYAEKCIEVIWLMYVHDPPMHLEWLTKEQEGSSFKTDLYSPYTTPGTLYDYCVWPVVRLHKNGPVLCKGIAQGR